MRLSWNEIRAKAARFADDWRGRGYERGDTQTFYNEFFEVFGLSRKRVAGYEQAVKGLADGKSGFLDLFWKGVLLVEQKSAGLDLASAKQQAFKYLPGIKHDKDLPRFILLCDFQTFELHDLETRETWNFGLHQLPEKVQLFSFMFGGVQRQFKDEDPVNIKASELMGELHDALKASNYGGHDLERFLVRLVFCLFADDTGIFTPRGIMMEYIEARTTQDGADLGPKLGKLFEVLNQDDDKRQTTLDEDLAKFPYVNGDLFAERLPLPDFDGPMRKLLLEACAFDWSKISPAIFGSLFQSVMDKKKRRAIGAHYTNEQNILKVIGPLFLDDLKAELKRLKARKDNGRSRALLAFQDKLAGITCLDPACGCGNFLVIAYRELRALETEVILDQKDNLDLFADKLSKVDVNQFYGIEFEEFPVRIAETALWMMDHIMNQRLSDELGEVKLRIPLKAKPTIKHGDALEVNWADVLPPENCSYVFGNPPFVGAKLQSDEQRKQVHRIANLGKKKGTLDFVCAWFLKAGEYVNRQPSPLAGEGVARGTRVTDEGAADVSAAVNTPLSPGFAGPSPARGEGRVAPSIGFVATNSISQGEQVAELWPLLFNRYGLEIAFAHRTFAWGSEARGKANVHVVIIGLTKRENTPAERRLFDYESIKADPVETKVKAISPYLFDAGLLADRHTVVRETSRPLSFFPAMVIGSKPIDGGYLIIDEGEEQIFLKDEPAAEQFLRPYIGSVDFIQGGGRHILALQNATPQQLRSMPHCMSRLEKVRNFRLGKIPARLKAGQEVKAPGISSRALATNPTAFHVTVIPTSPFLVVPEVSSENREYVPIGYLQPPIVPSNLVRIIPNATPNHFSLLTSRMHMAWLRFIGGRLKSDYRYSIGLVYNPFPWPDLDDGQKSRIAKLGQGILDARLKYPQSTLADLYDPLTMPSDLRKAHDANDKAVDQLYRKQPFASDRERVEFLLARYEQITAPALALAARKPKRGKNAGSRPSPG